MERICAGSTNLAVDRFGSGPPVVLAGGTGMPAVVWEVCGFVEALVTAGYEVVTYSARGVAPSDAPRAPYTIEEMAYDLAGLIETLALGPCSVIGYSLGGFQAELLARTRADLLRSVVLLASAGPLTDVLDAVIVAEGELLERLGSIPRSFLVLEGLTGSLPSELLRDEPDQVALWRELLAGQTDVWESPDGELGQWHAARAWTRNAGRMEALSGIEVPVLAVAFEQDLKFPPRGARLAVATMPRGEAVEIAGAAHGGLLTHTQATLEPVLSFLRSTTPAIQGEPRTTAG
jgi:pimeloyl-ACP methyl ester carboxylesterase